MSIVTLTAWALLRLQTVLPPTSLGWLRASSLVMGQALLLSLFSAILASSGLLWQVAYGTFVLTALAWWTHEQSPISVTRATHVLSVGLISLPLQVAAANLIKSRRRRPHRTLILLFTLAVCCTAIPVLVPTDNHPGDRGLLHTLPLTTQWLPAPQITVEETVVDYPPDFRLPTLKVRPNFLFVLPDTLSESSARLFLKILPDHCTLRAKHIAAEDPVDGAFALAYSIDSYHRLPFRHTGQTPVVGRLLEKNDYERISVAVRHLYNAPTLTDWGALKVAGPRQLQKMVNGRLANKRQRPQSLTVFPGDERMARKVLHGVSKRLGPDTIVIITGLSGPYGRTSLVSCAPVQWTKSPSHHALIWPTIMRVLGVTNHEWHLQDDFPPVISDAGFPFDSHSLTIVEGAKRRMVKLCAPGYLCFVPAEPDTLERMTQFLSYRH
ncbi:MAG: hypothetical protein VX223_17265 [Myxococcota bacterium]|nr:hypothetical protein [Myxococcota bacterium]